MQSTAGRVFETPTGVRSEPEAGRAADGDTRMLDRRRINGHAAAAAAAAAGVAPVEESRVRRRPANLHGGNHRRQPKVKRPHQPPSASVSARTEFYRVSFVVWGVPLCYQIYLVPLRNVKYCTLYQYIYRDQWNVGIGLVVCAILERRAITGVRAILASLLVSWRQIDVISSQSIK